MEKIFQLSGLLLEDMRQIVGVSVNQLTQSVEMSKHTYIKIKKASRAA